MTDHLTKPDLALARLQERTVPGMAHWAGTGPAGANCRECVFWGTPKGQKGYYSTMSGDGQLKPRPCRKYQNLMNGIAGKPVEFWRAACRHYEENPDPPPLTAKG